MRKLSFLLATLTALCGGCLAPPAGRASNAPSPAASGTRPAASATPVPAPASPPDLTKPLVVWNGDDHNPKSDQWSSCDTQPCAARLALLPDAGTNGSAGLECGAKLNAGYVGCGWNWTSWYAPAASDITGRKVLKFSLQIQPVSAELAPDPKAFRIGLRCAKSKTCGRVAENLAKYTATPTDGAWHEIAIPLTDFKSENQEEWDDASVWEIALHQWAPTPREFVARIDDIRFE